ncbi:CinA-like protein [Elysia marginata]|uniref:CinA-like protein n=1 Tax=Elysia marginata TaxID=1093978 RepID=A0AAV4G7U0_9GAST|nr:CinA-like protein [Elysia marginata]
MSQIYRAEIITIGEELLIGHTRDANANFIAKNLDSIGIEIYQIRSVPDDSERIVKAISEAKKVVDFIILTGGLGPTRDDVTKMTLCNYFNDILVENSNALKNIRLILSKLKIEISELNRKQAQVPSSAKVLPNKVGMAPGMWFDRDDYTLISLPGVPTEMRHILLTSVIPTIQKQCNAFYIMHKTIYVNKIPESRIAYILSDFEKKLPSNFSLAYLPSVGRVALRISGKGPKKIELNRVMTILVASVYRILGSVVGGTSEFEEIEKIILDEFTRRHITLCTSESCTGGAVSNRLVSESGSSQYFKGGVVCYDSDAKVDILKIDKSLIEKFSAVSSSIAEEMAVKTRVLFKTDYAISITGNAGPKKDKGSDAPVGTVFIGIASEKKVFSRGFNFGENREDVINRAVSKSLELILDTVRRRQ